MRRLTEMSSSERAALLENPTLTVPQLGHVLSLGQTTVREGLQSGEIDLPQIRVGTRVVIPSVAVKRWLGMPVDEATQ